MLRQGAAIAVTGGGSLSLAGLALPLAALTTALVGLAGAGSTLVFAAVSVPEHPEWGALTGTVTAAADGPPVFDPPGFILDSEPYFKVLSGPCTTALVDGHFCVGRWPGGYLPSEDCEIAVAGGAGALGPCPVFDINDLGGDSLTLPDGSRHSRADCPAGAALAAGQRLAWHSDDGYQGENGNGLPQSSSGAGGGWQVCFA